MLYLLDANVLIDANRDYYPLNRVPEFWAWLVDCGTTQRVKIPLEMYEEVLAGKNDALTNWLKGNRDALLLPEDVNRTVVARVTDSGYAPDLSDEEIERIGRDPFLIAYALSDRARRTVVTTEVSKPSRQRANRHIPDVCDGLGVLHCNTYEFIRVLDFTTGGGTVPGAVRRPGVPARQRARLALRFLS